MESDRSSAGAQPRQAVTLYTDGGCLGNPGPGGYGVVLEYRGHRKELSEGFARTTNNRMELLACIAGLEALKRPCAVTLHSDSRYVVDGISKGWARKWRERGWRKADKSPAENADLWERLLGLCETHRVTFFWVKAHAGIRENERCDSLAKAAAQGRNLKSDTRYETGDTHLCSDESGQEIETR